MSTIIQVKGLTKDFKEIKAVDDLSFQVSAGHVYGFLGQNGAGKSTTIRMLLTLIRPDSGVIEIFGMNLEKHRKEILRKVGAIIEKPDLYKYLTALENLRIFAAISGVKLSEKQLMDQLNMVGLAERAKSRVKTYSQGMKQRLGIATALVHDPELIILDEPTNGLDPVGIAEIRELIKNIAAEGRTIIMASHLLDEVEKVCTHVGILKMGDLLAAGKVDEVLVNEDIVEVGAANIQLLEQTLHSLNGYTSLKKNKEVIQLLYPVGTANLENINEYCFKNGVVLNHLQLKKKSLETKFLELTNK